MYVPAEKTVYIDIRSSAEVMLFGLVGSVDAHIPYLGGLVDEWNLFQQSFGSFTNNNFLHSVFELLREYGMYRDNPIVLITKSTRKGLQAASILNVAGFNNVKVEERGYYFDNRTSLDRHQRMAGKSGVAGSASGEPYLYRVAAMLH
jgi:rhodanese-related sulfurtransferase